jgi:hypothetical protein
MLIEKDGVRRKISDEETLKLFLLAGWQEVKEEKKEAKTKKNK